MIRNDAVIAMLLAALSCAAAGAAEPRPNVILILADDLRFDALGFMGNPVIRTPNIDRLAARGTVFSNAFVTTAICPISRASIITGQYERRHKIAGFSTALSPERFARTFPALLRRHGYRTGFLGKWGLGNPLPVAEYDFFRGFPGQGSYFPQGKYGQRGEHLTARQAAQAVEFLSGCTRARPFLLQISTKAPHVQDGDTTRPFPPDPKHEPLFVDVVVPKPPTADEAHFRALPDFLRHSEARTRWQPRFSTDALYQKTVKDYYRLIVGIDELVGAVLARLDESGLARNTVIIFTSDNGFYLGDRGLAGKWFMHEESIRVPLLVCDLRRPASTSKPSRRPELALNIDLAPTILELANIKPPPEMQGRSLVPLIEGRPTAWRDRFLYEHHFRHPRIPMSEGVRTTRWKYVRYVSVSPAYEELFDLQQDPLEEHNLAADAPSRETLDALRSEWTKLAKDAR